MEIEVTVRTDDGNEFKCVEKLPPLVVAELYLIQRSMVDYVSHDSSKEPSLAKVFLRSCTLGIDAWLKMYGAARWAFVQKELKSYYGKGW